MDYFHLIVRHWNLLVKGSPSRLGSSDFFFPDKRSAKKCNKSGVICMLEYTEKRAFFHAEVLWPRQDLSTLSSVMEFVRNSSLIWICCSVLDSCLFHLKNASICNDHFNIWHFGYNQMSAWHFLRHHFSEIFQTSIERLYTALSLRWPLWPKRF